MKYVEPIKSLVLTLLIMTSLLLTFMIWTYKPNYPLTEKTQAENIMLSEAKEKLEIIKPYRLLHAKDEDLQGTAEVEVINSVMHEFKTLKLSALHLEDEHASFEKINEMIRAPHRTTLFYPTDVPIDMYREMLSFEDEAYHKMTFNRMIIEGQGQSTSRGTRIYFVSTTENTIYSTTAHAEEAKKFEQVFNEYVDRFMLYEEIPREKMESLYVTNEQMKATQYTYYVKEISTDLLKNILFEEPNIVQKVEEGTQTKFSDSMSFLILNTQDKNMNYVYPAAESSAVIDHYRLLMNNIDYINDHGGFTSDYRLSKMDLENHLTEFQLYLQGYPVFSTDTFTRISTVWGENRVFRYHRPYYMLDMDITAETSEKQLVPGQKVIKHLSNYSEIKLDEVDDIVVGYHLVQNEDSRLFVLEPSWFVVSDGNWTRLTLDTVGGVAHGLE